MLKWTVDHIVQMSAVLVQNVSSYGCVLFTMLLCLD